MSNERRLRSHQSFQPTKIDPSLYHPEMTPEQVKRAFARKPNIPTKQPEGITRRRLGTLVGLIAAAGVVGVDQSFWFTKENPAHSSIYFPPDQEKRLRDAKSLCLFIGGFNVQAPDKITAGEVTPALEALGPVGFAHFTNRRLDARGLADSFLSLKEQYGIEELNADISSAGILPLGDALTLLGNEMRFRHAILSATPVSIKTTRVPAAEYVFGALDKNGYKGGVILTGAATMQNYGDPFQEGAAPPGLFWNQIQAGLKAEPSIQRFINRVQQDGTKLAYVKTIHPEKDPAVDTAKSEQALREAGLAPYMMENPPQLGGNEGHENFADNKEEYLRVYREIISRWKTEGSL